MSPVSASIFGVEMRSLRSTQAAPFLWRGCRSAIGTDGSRQRLFSQLGLRAKDESNSNNAGDKPADLLVKGKLITTPSRLFKLVVPLTTIDRSVQRGVEPVAIVLHPQQPLSHLERFIQSELPPIKGDPERHPRVTFMALRHDDTFIRPRHVIYEGPDMEMREAEFGDKDGAGVQKAKDSSYSRRGLVRWAQSTEIGDFIKDVSQVREFVMAIDSADGQQRIHVEVPSFSERTYFLRMRLRKLSKRIQSIAEVKQECDAVAHRGAQRVAIGGFGVLASWWYIVYRITFETDLGWDTMEPVTYLASLSTLMGGYLWFLYHNREISYRSALDITVSARQRKLYQMKGVDPSVWATLIDEGNALRREIKNIAAEYEVEWDERGDEQDERVTEALKRERLHKNGTKHGSKDDDEDNE